MTFEGSGKKPGMEVWRIEKMEPKPWTDIGKFCEGDSYIVLKTTARPGHSSFDWDIHFWLGKDTSQDEKGVAAYKTVELDDYLGGAPVQHREVQGHESEKFLSYFKSGVEYVAGGVESGFTKVERDVYETRLLQCKGKRSVRVTPRTVVASSLNSGDVFILDCGLTIYQWNGSESNRKEKAKALDVTTSIKNDERGGRAKVIVIDEGSETDAFWTAIGGKGAVSAASPDDDAKVASTPAKLYRVSDAGGEMKVSEEGSGSLKKSMLDTNDVFLVDTGAEVFVWVGKKANSDEKKNGMITAQKFLDQQGKDGFTKLTKVIEGGETPLFKEKFADWSDMRPPTDFSKRPGQSSSAKVEQKEINVGDLLNSSNPADSVVDDGSGKLQVWRIKDFDKEELPEDIYGNFYAGDSYIVLYTYKQGSKECYLIYFWQGRDSSQDEKGAAAILATKMDDDLHGAATQVRVVQGKEPAHFLTIFKGSMVVHSGGTASGFKNKADQDSYDTDGVSLFHVKGTNPLNTRGVQVEEQAKWLNSGDAFVLKNPETVYLWYGKGCSGDERTSAMKLATSMKDGSASKSVTEVEEGQEPDKFWEFLGGKAEYASSKELVDAPRDPRLFQCSNATGRFDVEEIFEFAQDDLDDADVFLLDVWSEVYVWVGKKANAEEKSKASEMAAKFIAATPGRSEDTPTVLVHSGAEPPMFTAAFLGWDANQAKGFEDPYEKKLRLLREAQGGEEEEAAPAPAPVAAANYADPASTSYPLSELKAKTAPDVDPKQREQYLSDADFQEVFKMDKAAFVALKGWKKDDLKKKNGLF